MNVLIRVHTIKIRTIVVHRVKHRYMKIGVDREEIASTPTHRAAYMPSKLTRAAASLVQVNAAPTNCLRSVEIKLSLKLR